MGRSLRTLAITASLGRVVTRLFDAAGAVFGVAFHTFTLFYILGHKHAKELVDRDPTYQQA